MNDDLRQLAEVDFPRLARDIASQALSRCDWQPAQFHPGNVDYRRPMNYMGPSEIDGKPAFGYCPYNYDGSPRTQAQIWFYAPRLVEVTGVEPGDIEDLDPGAAPEQFTVDSHANDGPSKIKHTTRTETESESEDEHSWSETTSKEFTARIKMAAEAGISIELLDVGTSGEFEQTLTKRLERTESGAWRKSDRVLDVVEREYSIFPYMDWSLTSERSVKHIRQGTTAMGRLECKVRVDVQDWSSSDFDSLSDLYDLFRGLKTGHARFGQWWSSRTSWNGGPPAIADDVIAKWHRPVLTLTSTVEGKRTRYTRGSSRQTPIAGREPLALSYLKEHGFTLDAIQAVYGQE